MRKLPAVDDEFAKDLGVENIEALGPRSAPRWRGARTFADQEVDRALLDAWSIAPRRRCAVVDRGAGPGAGGDAEADHGRGAELPEAEKAELQKDTERRCGRRCDGVDRAFEGSARHRAGGPGRIEKIAESSGRPLAQVRAEVARHGTETIEPRSRGEGPHRDPRDRDDRRRPAARASRRASPEEGKAGPEKEAE